MVWDSGKKPRNQTVTRKILLVGGVFMAEKKWLDDWSLEEQRNTTKKNKGAVLQLTHLLFKSGMIG